MHAVQASAAEQEALMLINALAQELASGSVELPGIPDVSLRVRRVLDDERVSASRLECIVGSEPVLASRIVRYANSAVLGNGGRKASDLRTAISRIGFDMVRSMSMAFTLAQVRRAGELRRLAAPLNELWKRCTLVAALARVVAMRLSRLNPDTALFAGLLHGVGELYVLTRLKSYPNLSEVPDAVLEWHPQFAKSILDSWQIDGEVSNAVAGYRNLDREHPGDLDLTDVLSVAFVLAAFVQRPETLGSGVVNIPVCQRLQLTVDDFVALIAESREQIDALREALDY